MREREIKVRSTLNEIKFIQFIKINLQYLELLRLKENQLRKYGKLLQYKWNFRQQQDLRSIDDTQQMNSMRIGTISRFYILLKKNKFKLNIKSQIFNLKNLELSDFPVSTL